MTSSRLMLCLLTPFLAGSAIANSVVFNVNGTTQNGSTISGTLTIDTTAGSVTAANITLGAPDSVTCTTITARSPGNPDYELDLGCTSSADLILDLPDAGSLIGYSGGAVEFLSLFEPFTGFTDGPFPIATVSPALPPTTFTKAFTNTVTQVGGTDTLTFTISDTANVTNMAFTDTFPGTLVVATPNGLTTPTGCGTPTITATAGSATVSFSNGTLTGGTPCTFSVNVTSASPGTFLNSVSMTANAVSGGPATATVTYVAPPTISKVFGAPRIPVGGSTSLSFTITNPVGNSTNLQDVIFTDTLPTGLVISTPSGLTGSCPPGTITAVAGTISLALSGAGATLNIGLSCTFSVNVTGVAVGTQPNTTSTVTSFGGTIVGNTASASIMVDPADGVLIGYVSNLNAGDSSVDITNGGLNGAFLGQNGSNGDICANVYVFDPGQELLACCSCLVTPDGLNSFSVKNDLINKSLTSVVPTSLVIKIVATPRTATTCAGTAAAPPSGALAGGLRAWGTTSHQNTTAGYSVTENAFQPVNVGTAELTSLSQMCGFVIAEGSNNFGFCNNACANTGLSGAKK